MNIEQARFHMIEQQIRPWDVLDLDVLELLNIVKREDFVPAPYKNLAFSDTEIPLPCGASMFTPKLEARILQEAAVKKHENVLEIGAGSGYMAALLAFKARHVTTIEIAPELHAMAKQNLANYRVTNVNVELGDGAQGWGSATSSQYDVIIVSGGLPVVPQTMLEQIKIGGRLLAFVGTAPVMQAQIITRISEIAYNTINLFETSVQPLHHAVTPSQFTF